MLLIFFQEHRRRVMTIYHLMMVKLVGRAYSHTYIFFCVCLFCANPKPTTIIVNITYSIRPANMNSFIYYLYFIHLMLQLHVSCLFYHHRRIRKFPARFDARSSGKILFWFILLWWWISSRSKYGSMVDGSMAQRHRELCCCLLAWATQNKNNQIIYAQYYRQHVMLALPIGRQQHITYIYTASSIQLVVSLFEPALSRDARWCIHQTKPNNNKNLFWEDSLFFHFS